MDLDRARRRRTIPGMAEKKTGDPKDGKPHVGGPRFVPVAGVYGTSVVVPGPLTPGTPKPEPANEHWTLAPGHRPDPAPAADGEVPAEQVPVEPVRGTVTRPPAEETETDPA
jgi:hypothetical protein